nr:autotransporter domain-containing protein [Pseudodesulfovibrio sp.]
MRPIYNIIFSPNRLTLFVLLPMLLALLQCLPAQAASVNTTPGGDIDISGDGSIVVINRNNNIYASPSSLGSSTLIDSSAEIVGISQDGSHILGKKNSNFFYIYSGTNHQTTTFLTPLIATPDLAGISSDGHAVFGSRLSVGAPNEALIAVSSDNWTTAGGITDYSISYGPTGSMPDLNAISNNIAGVRTAVGAMANKPMTWETPTVGNTLVGTPLSLGSYTSGSARDITDDGSMAVGNVNTTYHHAAIWNIMTNSLTVLPSGGYNNQNANFVNKNGSVIVGDVCSAISEVAIWTENGNSYTVQTLYDALISKGVQTDPNNYFMTATGLSDDGDLITGQRADSTMFIANLGAGGVITTEQLNESLATMGQVGSAVSGMGQLSMSRLGNVAGGQGAHFHVTTPGTETAGGGAERGLSSGDEMPGSMDLWVIGSVGSNIELNGDDLGLRGGVGLTWDNGNEWRFGGGVFGDMRDLKTNHGGDQSIRAIGPGVFAVYSPEQTGFEFRLSALWQSVALDLTRGYANGAGSATSSGSTDANVFGLSGRVQWTKNMTDSFDLTPFAEYTWQTTHIDSYSESGGPFPASFESRTETSNSIRAGLRADAALFDKVGTWAWLAWDHRFEDSSAGMGGSTIGLGAFTYPGAKLDQDWADAGVGASWDITERLEATSSLGFAMGCDDETVPDLTATMGLSYQLW